jgi:hypothetical protein
VHRNRGWAVSKEYCPGNCCSTGNYFPNTRAHRIVAKFGMNRVPFFGPVPLPPAKGKIELRTDVDYDRLLFGYWLPGDGWRVLPHVFDASTVSGEAGPPTLPNFTGAYAGVCCQNLAGTRRPADFDDFAYHERAHQPRLTIQIRKQG